ncbi:hypothetical protein Ssi02_44520 [Sinosporangium siamense]|uniref:Uncharacterized protein n=1 Tax=Sinosporangium siamense TaxID=1367973 RepID=A0A919RHY5_9ACTN|nr:hypothetical protein Ssi02_44520 [Sinosporangium siamense]
MVWIAPLGESQRRSSGRGQTTLQAAETFTDRVEQAQQPVVDRDRTPALADADRELLGETLSGLRRVIGERGGAEQLLHGEPHSGNAHRRSKSLDRTAEISRA